MEAMGGGPGSHDVCRAVVVSVRHGSKANDDAVGIGTAHVQKHHGLLEEDLQNRGGGFVLQRHGFEHV